MKLGRISVAGCDGAVGRIVAVHPDQGRVVDLARAETLRLRAAGASDEGARRLARALFPSSMSAAIAMGDEFLARAEAADAARGDDASLAIDAVTWLPASDPRVLRDCMTFPVHLKNSLSLAGLKASPVLKDLPGFYKTSPTTLVGHDAEVPWPSYSQFMDYELELGFVIGRQAGGLTPEEAGKAIFGLTIFNDFTARDIIREEMQMGLGPTKGKDFASGIGPWITTIDEFGGIDGFSIEGLKAVARVNGETWSVADTRGMMWSPSELVAYISQGDCLQPGDVIGSGTVGNGCGLELGRQLQPGDVVELEVPGLGILRNRMGRPKEGRWWPRRQESIPILSL